MWGGFLSTALSAFINVLMPNPGYSALDIGLFYPENMSDKTLHVRPSVAYLDIFVLLKFTTNMTTYF